MDETVLIHMANCYFYCSIIFVAIEIISNTSWLLFLTPCNQTWKTYCLSVAMKEPLLMFY